MRKPIIYLCGFFLFMLMAGHSRAQTSLDKKIDVSFDGVKLKKVLKTIEEEAGLNFSYSKKIIPAEELINYTAKGKSVSAILKEILIPIGVDFQLVENYIVLRPSHIDAEQVTGKSPKTKSTYTLNGNITDSSSGEMLIGATILVEELQTGTITNPYGFFSLTLPAGEYTIKTRYIGYKETVQKISLDKNLQFDAHLDTDSELLPEVIVSDNNSLVFVENIQMGYNELKPAEVAQTPALMGEKDVIRALQTVPGIKMYADGSTMFHVRGGNRDQNLILLDEAPLYNPAHLLGLYSTIIPEATKDIRIYKGDIPVQYGGRLSSLIDIKTNEGNLKRFGLSGSIGLSALRLVAEGPLKKDKSSYFVAGRISNLNWFTKGVLNTNSDIGFYDLNTKFNISLNKNNRLFFSFYSGMDEFEDDSNSGIEWGNLAASLRWNHIFNNRLFSNTTLYTSGYNYYLFTNKQRGDAWHSAISNLSLKSDFSYFINPENNLFFGVSLGYHNFNPGNYEPGSGGQPSDVPYVPKKNANEITLYVGNEQQFFERVYIKYGLRFLAWQNIGPTTEITYNDQYEPIDAVEYAGGDVYNSYVDIEPRLALTYRFSDAFSSKIFYNRNVQNIHLITNSISPFTNFEVWLPSSLNIKPQKADQLGFGIFRKVTEKGYSISGEAYYKWMDNQIEYTDHASVVLNPFIEGELRFGEGHAYGGELELKKETGKFTGWIGYAYSRSIIKVIGLNENEAYPTFYDRPHEISTQLNYKPASRWDFSLNWIYTSGAAFTTPTGFFNYNEHTVPIYSNRGNDRLPDYHRMDLSINFRLNRYDARFRHYLNFSIYNLYGQKNPVYVNFNKTLDDGQNTKVPGDYYPNPGLQPSQTFIYSVIPSISYNFKL